MIPESVIQNPAVLVIAIPILISSIGIVIIAIQQFFDRP